MEPAAFGVLQSPPRQDEKRLEALRRTVGNTIALGVKIVGQTGYPARVALAFNGTLGDGQRDFKVNLKPETWPRYADVMVRLVSVVYRVEALTDVGDSARPPYELTGKQRDLWKAFVSYADDNATSIVDRGRLGNLSQC